MMNDKLQHGDLIMWRKGGGIAVTEKVEDAFAVVTKETTSGSIPTGMTCLMTCLMDAS